MKTRPTPKAATVQDLALPFVFPDDAPRHSFYRPHKRVTYSDDLVNHTTGVVTKPVRRVKQNFKDECDINKIVKSYSVTGQYTHIRANATQGAYRDLPDNMDFQEAIHTVEAGKAAFATLPSHVRDRFQNDPFNFLAFMADPTNQDEIIKLGLAADLRPPTTATPPSSSTGDLKIAD